MVIDMEAHPSAEIAAALAACRRGGLLVKGPGQGLGWGWVECATGARRLAVPVRPADERRHSTRIMIFRDSHVTHRPRRRRAPAAGGGR